MKLFAISTDQMSPVESIFLQTCPSELEVTIKRYQHSGPYKWGSQLFISSIKEKLNMIIEAISHNLGKIILVTDIDLQFFNNCQKHVLSAIAEKDIIFQSERYPFSRIVNPGFMAIRCNERSLLFWNRINSIDIKKYPRFEMSVINNVLQEKTVNIRWGVFDNRIWAYSHGIESLNPFRVIVHHANCAGTLELKIKQFEFIKKRVEFYRKYPITYYAFSSWVITKDKFLKSAKKELTKLAKLFKANSL